MGETLIKFGQRMREMRIAANITQEELAFRAGLHRTYIGSVERGERNVSLRNLVRIAKALDVSASALLVGLDS